MIDLRLVRHAHGRRRRARLQDARCTPIVERRPRPGDLGDGQPAGDQGPRRRHGSLLGTSSARSSRTSQPGYDQRRGARARRHAGADGRDPQGVALHQLRLLRLGVQLDGVRPRLPRPGGARQGACASSATRATATTRERLEELQRRARHLGLHPLLLLQRALPQGRRPARRDREARRRGDQARHRPRHGREARQVVRHSAKTTGWLRETELVPKTQGIVSSIKEIEVRADGRSARIGKVPPSVRRRTWRARGKSARTRSHLVQGARTTTRSKRLLRSCSSSEAPRGSDGPRTRPTASPDRLRREPRTDGVQERYAYYTGCLAVALAEGARHLDAGARAEARRRAGRARVGHVLRRRRHPRGRARLLPAPERAHPRLRRGDGLRHADDDLQRLHAQPAPGEPPAAGATTALLERINENLAQVGVAALRGQRRGAAPALGVAAGRAATSAQGRSRTRASRASRSRRSTAARSCARRSCSASRIPTSRARSSGSSRPAAARRSTTRRRSSAAASRSSRRARRRRSAS